MRRWLLLSVDPGCQAHAERFNRHIRDAHVRRFSGHIEDGFTDVRRLQDLLLVQVLVLQVQVLVLVLQDRLAVLVTK